MVFSGADAERSCASAGYATRMPTIAGSKSSFMGWSPGCSARPEASARRRRRDRRASRQERPMGPRAPGERRGAAGELYRRTEEHTSELQARMRISDAVFHLKKQKSESQNGERE